MNLPKIFRRRRRPRCAVCEDFKTVLAGQVFKRHIICTCGQGDDPAAMHDTGCDTVPCPFCTLLKETVLA